MTETIADKRLQPRWLSRWFAHACALLAAVASAQEKANDAATPNASSSTSENIDPLHPLIEIDTNLGKIRLRLDAEYARATVRNFRNYIDTGFYTDTLFHYVDADKMIVGGGYTVDGRPKPAAASVRNEAHNGLNNVRGTIAMARDVSAGIDSATSQFFINLADSPNFDHRGDGPDEYGYCVFGEVIDGLDVAEKISRASTSDQGGDLAQTPTPPVIIKSIEVVE